MTPGCDLAGVITANGLNNKGEPTKQNIIEERDKVVRKRLRYIACSKKANTDGIILLLWRYGRGDNTVIYPRNKIQ